MNCLLIVGAMSVIIAIVAVIVILSETSGRIKMGDCNSIIASAVDSSVSRAIAQCDGMIKRNVGDEFDRINNKYYRNVGYAHCNDMEDSIKFAKCVEDSSGLDVHEMFTYEKSEWEVANATMVRAIDECKEQFPECNK